MTSMMKAPEKSRPKPGLWMVNAAVPRIGPENVLIRVNKTGICSTDVHIWNWDDRGVRTIPMPP